MDIDSLDEGEFDEDDLPLIPVIQIIQPTHVKTFIGYKPENKERYSYNSAVKTLLRSIRNNKGK